MWDQRYAEPGFAYGTAPNDFLREQAARFPPAGRLLSVAEGEGRNAVFLAALGHTVTAVDQSAVGLAKAARLAAERKVPLATRQADLTEFDLGIAAWDGIVSVWAHLPADVRRVFHKRCVASLKPHGIFLLEAYSPRQLSMGTGGPSHPSFLMPLADVQNELSGLHFEIAREIQREVHEGAYHNGPSWVLQILGIKPA
ncbi:MAG: class I SAM-dependent methyltransferase [Elusimicrobia bacterium]|nr:class I SAM-dependent methyltransferase [Elusimicrobiota bacterium]